MMMMMMMMIIIIMMIIIMMLIIILIIIIIIIAIAGSRRRARGRHPASGVGGPVAVDRRGEPEVRRRNIDFCFSFLFSF